MSTGPTPRTDAIVMNQERTDGDIDQVVPAEFARQLECQLATVAQAEREQCAKECDKEVDCWTFEDARQAAGDCATRIRALAPHAGKQLTALIDELAALPGLSKLPLLPIEAILIEKTELSRLRTVAEAAKAEVKSNAWASLTLVAAVRALERGEVKS